MPCNYWEIERALFDEECKKAVSIAKDNLKRLMEDNKGTQYGKKYGFENISNYEEYRNQVPLSDYTDYKEYVEEMRQGKEQELTAYPIKHFILTSGSTGEQKRIPLTKEALRRCIRPIYYASYQEIPKIEEGRYLHMSVFRRELPREERETILSVAYFGEMMDQGIYDLEKRYLGAPNLLFSKKIGCVPYVKAWLALQTEEISGIQAFFLYDILLFCHWLEENWQELLNHMEAGDIPEEIALEAEIKEELLAMGILTKERAEFLRSEFLKGMEGILERLWPHMKFISGVGGSTFFAQENALRKYLGKIPIHYFSYAASECMMAIVTEKESVDNVLIPKSGFYEFIPYHQGESREDEIKPIWQLKEGEMYEIVITNFSGFYRYRLNDIVKVVGFRGEAPILHVCFRKNQALNIAGEKIDMQVMAKAMEEFGKKVNCQIKEFSIVENTESVPGNYRCFYEAGEQENYPTPETAGEILDKILSSVHEDYKDVRELGMLAAPQLYRVKAGSHGECKKVFGSLLAQNKPLQYLSKPETVEFMLERVM
ncbi:MAG: GH3 auxin-responsive promoter family protein [Lachnospiraceae bacterium]|nr:GH3 auxin-responsive promoter family protein [Lachnospiraceae bacterium]